MEQKSSIDKHSDEDYLAFEIIHDDDGGNEDLRVETSRNNVWRFDRRGGEWIPESDDIPSPIISALEFQDYEIAD